MSFQVENEVQFASSSAAHSAFVWFSGLRFIEANPEGKVPVMRFEEKWVSDSDVITQMLEQKFPERPLATPQDKAAAYLSFFPLLSQLALT